MLQLYWHTRKVAPGTHTWDPEPETLHVGPFIWDPGLYMREPGLNLFKWNAGPMLKNPYINTTFS